MYKNTHNLIAIPITDFLRPSRHYHPLSYRLITATTDYYKFSFFPRAVFHWKNLHLEIVVCSTLKKFNQEATPRHIKSLLRLNLTYILAYFILVVVYWLHPPSLCLALLIFLQLDAHMSRSPTGVS